MSSRLPPVLYLLRILITSWFGHACWFFNFEYFERTNKNRPTTSRGSTRRASQFRDWFRQPFRITDMASLAVSMVEWSLASKSYIVLINTFFVINMYFSIRGRGTRVTWKEWVVWCENGMTMREIYVKFRYTGSGLKRDKGKASVTKRWNCQRPKGDVKVGSRVIVLSMSWWLGEDHVG